MRNLLKEGSDWLQATQRAYCAEAISYQSGDVVRAGIPATKGRGQHEVDDQSGMLTKFETDDWLIAASDLTSEPAIGDTITDAGGIIYRVLNIPGGDCWTWANLYRTQYRVHSKFVGSA